jgi:hypothetical protein
MSTELTAIVWCELLDALVRHQQLDLSPEDAVELLHDLENEYQLDSWVEEGLDHVVKQVGNRYVLYVTEAYWIGIYDSLDEAENSAQGLPVTPANCKRIFLEAIRDRSLSAQACALVFEIYSERVFHHEWANAAHSVLRIGETYVLRLADNARVYPAERSWIGPFDSLSHALPMPIQVGPTTQIVESSEWSSEELIARLHIKVAPASFSVNDQQMSSEMIELVQRRQLSAG